MRAFPVPGERFQWIAVLWLVFAALAAGWPVLRPVWELTGALIAATALADLWLGWRLRCPITIDRQMAKNWPLAVSQDVRIRISANDSPTRLSGRVFDDVPGTFRFSGLPRDFSLTGTGPVEITYQVQPRLRGSHRFGRMHVLLTAPLGLWLWRYRIEAGGSEADVRVYPDFAKVVQYAALATDHRLGQIGLMQRRRRGQGMEFQQLREYRMGDTVRQIDWKASARQGKLIAREYHDERNQQVLLLVDCGLRMRSQERPESLGSSDPPLSHFDHTLNAMLLLSYVALRQGDGVGMATFAHPTPRFMGPRRSQATLSALLNAVYDLEPSALTPDFLEAARFVMKHLRKRALIVILTNLRDEDEDTLMPALRLLSRHHLVVVASLHEPGLTSLREHPVAQFEEALAYAAATEYLYARQRWIAKIRRSGVRCLDLAPKDLPIGLVNQYWSMKRGGVF